MSDENKKPNFSSWHEWARLSPGWDPAVGLLGVMQQLESTMSEASKPRKSVLDLVPGDVITVRHVTIFVVGVRLQESVDPNKQERGFAVQVAGATAEYYDLDWHWRSNNIIWYSPFLSFHPNDEVTLERQSPSGGSTLDRLIEFREKAQARKNEEAEKTRKWVRKTMAEGKNAYPHKMESEEASDSQEDASSTYEDETPGDHA